MTANSHSGDHSAVLLQSSALSDTFIPLDDELRLNALLALEVLDAPVQRNFQMLTELANQLLEAPVSLITLVTDDRQFFVSSNGLGQPWAEERQTPLSHSFCQHVVNRNEPLIVNDARKHPLVCDNLAIRDLGVASYFGVPLVHDGIVLGSFCVIDDSPREWTKHNLDSLTKLASLAVHEMANHKASQAKQSELESRLRQSQKMEAIGQLTAGVAHDFNNVLYAIQIRSNLLRRVVKNSDTAARHLEEIEIAVDSARGIVGQLLRWSRPGPRATTVISLASMIEKSLPLLQTTLSPSVNIQFNPTDDAARIEGDVSQIRQVLLNLCSNSNYSMRHSGGDIRILVSTRDLDEDAACDLGVDPGAYVELEVSDEGIGIESELLERIHDPYFTTKPVGEGTGLGLWTVFGIVRRHNGQIRVASMPGKGATFRILFPACLQSSTSESQPVASGEVQHQGQNAKVMIVDDDAQIANGLSALMSEEGYDTACFTSSPDALEYFLADPQAIDIVIADRAMPGMSGDELVSRIKSVRPSLPVIISSGYVDDTLENGPNERRPDAYCIKPHDFDDLCKIVENLLSRE